MEFESKYIITDFEVQKQNVFQTLNDQLDVFHYLYPDSVPFVFSRIFPYNKNKHGCRKYGELRHVKKKEKDIASKNRMVYRPKKNKEEVEIKQVETKTEINSISTTKYYDLRDDGKEDDDKKMFMRMPTRIKEEKKISSETKVSTKILNFEEMLPGDVSIIHNPQFESFNTIQLVSTGVVRTNKTLFIKDNNDNDLELSDNHLIISMEDKMNEGYDPMDVVLEELRKHNKVIVVKSTIPSKEMSTQTNDTPFNDSSDSSTQTEINVIETINSTKCDKDKLIDWKIEMMNQQTPSIPFTHRELVGIEKTLSLEKLKSYLEEEKMIEDAYNRKKEKDKREWEIALAQVKELEKHFRHVGREFNGAEARSLIKDMKSAESYKYSKDFNV